MTPALQNFTMADGSRQFATLPQTVTWYEMRDHIAQLEGAKITGFLTDGITEAWIDFADCGYKFTINDQHGEFWLFVNSRRCSEDILTTVAAHVAQLTGLTDAWEQFCGDLDCVSVYRGSIFDVSCDAVVSPANSFGFMDGGIDLLYSQRFGWHVQARLQEQIRVRHHGELLVGAAEIVETGYDAVPFLIAAPTMRVPMRLQNSVNPYLAARAALLLAKHGTFGHSTYAGEKVSRYVQTVAFPGLGTGVGQIGPNTCAHQMRAALENVVSGSADFPASWAEAQKRHQLLYTDRVRDLQHEL